MRSLFPEMEAEIREDRKAARRERRQRARDWLRNQDTSWLINRLLDKGPASECQLLMEITEEYRSAEDAPALAILGQLHNLNIIGKLWKQSLGVHPGAGVTSFRFGIRNVHPQNS